MSLDLAVVAELIDETVDRRLASVWEENKQLKARIAELEACAPLPGPKGDSGADGKSVEIEAVRDIVEAITAKELLQLERRATDYLERLKVRDGVDGAPGMDGRDGQDADEDAIARRVLEAVSKDASGEVQKAIAAIPQVKDGRDGIDGRDGQDGSDGQDGKPGIDGRDGQDADEEAIVRSVLEAVRKEIPVHVEKTVSVEVAKIPLPQDGRDGSDGKDGAPGIDGKDGSDGVSGKDGAPGEKGMDGRDVTPEMVDASIAKWIEPHFARIELSLERRAMEWLERTRDEARKMIEAIPKPRDGRDGIGVKDIAIEYDGARKVTLRHQTEGGEVVKELYLPIPLYRDVWKADLAYSQHDMTTHDGSTWIALEDSKGIRPGHMQKAWKLIVKKGRDGK